MLKELAEIGMELARVLLRREAAKAVDDDTGRDPQVAFARVSRSVRLTAALCVHLRQQRQAVAAKAGPKPVARKHNEGAAVDAEPITPARVERVKARLAALCRRSELLGRMAPAIEAETPDRGDRERLLADLRYRLDVATSAADFVSRPIDEVIAEIRYSMGLGPKPAAPMAASNDDAAPDNEDFDDEDRDDDEPGGSIEPPWLEPGWGTAPSRPRRGSG